MEDRPGRPADQPDGRDSRPDRGSDGGGWGSPVPSEYGSLRSARGGDPARDGERPARARRDQADAADRRGMGSLRRRLQPTGLAPAGGGDDRDGADGAAPAATEPAVGSEPGANGSAPAATGGNGSAPQAASRPGPVDGRSRAAASPASDFQSGPPAGIHDGPAEPPTSQYAAVPVSTAQSPAGPSPLPAAPAAGPDAFAAAFGAGDQPYGRRRPLRRPVRGRSRATVRHLDVVTVVRVSVIFYLVILIVFVVASLFLWLAADTFGSLPSIEKSVRTLFSLRKFTLHPATVALYTGLAGLVLTVAGTLWNILLAVIYNLIADVVGGVRVELESFTKE